VQWGFGGLIALVAWGFVHKALLGYGFDAQTANAIGVGAVLVFLAAYWLPEGERPSEQRVKQACLVLAGVSGFFVMGRPLLGAGSAPAAVTGVASSLTGPVAALTERKGNLTWYLDKSAAYEAAARSGKPVCIDFHGDWCTNCTAFQKKTLQDAELNDALHQAVLLKVHDTSALFEEYIADPRLPELKVGLPLFTITDTKGNVLYKTSHYTKTHEMILFLTG